jgi:hypothetical protein
MKIWPTEDVSGVRLPESLRVGRRSVGRAVHENGAGRLGEHFRAWRAWAVHVENDSSEPSALAGPASFVWSCGRSSSVRFETACLAYAYARALFKLRKYAVAYAHFGLALEEVMQCRDPLPLSADECAGFRLRCLVRAQRLGICEFRLDSATEMLPRAIWLESALRTYAELPKAARKESLEAGECLVATARAALTQSETWARRATRWSQNPFSLMMDEIAERGESKPDSDADGPDGFFDWTRFTSDRPYVA